MQIPALSKYFTRLLPTNLIFWVYEFAKNELSNRKELLDFDKEENEESLIWFEYRDFDITLQSYPDNLEDVHLWSISQKFENLFYYKTTHFCSVTDATQEAKDWVDSYIQAKKEVFRASCLPKEREENSFLYSYRNFKILCVGYSTVRNSIDWYIYDKENNFLMESWQKSFLVREARDAGYRWVHDHIYNGMLKDGTIAYK